MLFLYNRKERRIFMFIDRAVIEVRSGKGGDGAIAFLREKYVAKGGPAGGNGGRGGSIFLRASKTINTLFNFRHSKTFIANDGEKGGIKNQYGKYAEDVIVDVPIGTVVYLEEGKEFLGDLNEDGKIIRVAKGGRGGRGNSCFKSSTNRVPKIAENGEPGERKRLILELKLLADVERCRLIVHVIDLSETGRDPYNDYVVINKELEQYGFALDKRPQIIVASKMDEEGAKEKLAKLEKQIGQEIIPISAITEENIDKLLYKCSETLKNTPLFPLYDEKEEDLDHKTYTLEDEEPFFTIRRIDAHTWSIEGDKMLKFYKMTNISTDEGMMVLMSKIRSLRIDDELENRGAEDGDTVILDDFEFEYVR